MVLTDEMRAYYRDHPLMVSSPFGGVEGVNRELLLSTFDTLGVALDGRRILDVGCGRGYLEEVVREQGGAYVGVDLVPSRAGFALALADGAALPFPDGVFDGVCCIDAFEHFPEAERGVAEFHRVLSPQGFVFLSAPNYANVAGLVKAYCERFGDYEPDTWAPFRNWCPQEFERPLTGRVVRRLFRRGGFTRFRRIAHGPEVGLGLFPWIEHSRMPETLKFRLQRGFGAIGPAIARVWPGTSLHHFWKIQK